ncbi:MAG: S8 family serine peptidase [Acidobacteria bacterium]|nr:S8 family serine peptidase [Acidobacteriota bacterium]
MQIRATFLLLFASLAFGQYVPNRYIVELDEAPMAHSWKQRRSVAFEAQRTRLQQQQTETRRELARRKVKVRASVDTVANAIIVESADRAALENMPGVVRVNPVRKLKPFLDHVAALTKFSEAWATVGGEGQAGTGIKIAMLDTGIDPYHAAFQDSTITAPDGYPKFSPSSNRLFTSGKIIVARSYDGGTVEDSVGHGTGTSMAAAGVVHTGPFGKIAGAAPKAFLGMYKVFDEFEESLSEDFIVQALDDAVKDGMDVVNMSLGGPATSYAEDMSLTRWINAAIKAGVIVVVAAANSGPDLATVSDNSAVPEAIAVGSTQNDRGFAVPSIVILPNTALRAEPASNSENAPSLTGEMIDIIDIDRTGLGCGAYPANSLLGKIALIQRGTCTFEEKFNNAQNAGAIAAVIFDNAAGALFGMNVGSATLLGMSVTRANGFTLRDAVAANPSGGYRLSFANSVAQESNVVSSFSSRGPTPDALIKPDLLAIGGSIWIADSGTVDNDPSTSFYTFASGTSLSAPIVAGAAAVLKQARPNLTVAQYRSLLVNSANPFPAGSDKIEVMTTGAGILNFPGMMNATTAVSPVTLSLGEIKGQAVSNDFTITNVGTNPANLTINVITRDAVQPELSTKALTLEAGASETVKFSWTNTTVNAGAYQGFLEITGGPGGTARVPYWTAVRGKDVNSISVIWQYEEGTPGGVAGIWFRNIDTAGLSLLDPTPEVTVESGGGSVVSTEILGPPENTGVYLTTVRLGTRIGNNVFKIRVGGVEKLVTIEGVR